MEICDFVYHRPTSLAQACGLAHELGADARLLAGGTDLLVDLKQRRIQAAHLIDLSRVDELRRIELRANVLHVGALVTMSELAHSAVVRTAAPALAEAAAGMGCEQIRNRATLGGNFCAAVPCADTPPICMASGAELRIAGARGERTLAAESFFVGPRQTVLQAGEVLAELLIPAAAAQTGAAYHRFARRRSTSLAVAGAAAQVTLDGVEITAARVALTAVAPTPLLVRAAGEVLGGKAPTDELLQRAAAVAADAARPITDLRGSEAYRRDLVVTLTRRALGDAVSRAREGN